MTRSEKVPPRSAQDGWIRSCDHDAGFDLRLPLPTRIISNEEYAPPPQLPEQRRVERAVLERADALAPRLGLDRRQFLRTTCGMAAAFAAMNSVFGPFFRVEAAELTEPRAASLPRYFVLDAQTHFVDALKNPVAGDQKFLEYLLGVRRFGGRFNPELAGREIAPEELHRLNFIKEVFLDSETAVAVVSGLPQWAPDTYVASPDRMAETRTWVNELTGSRRVLCHGIMSPELGQRGLDAMRAQAEKFKVEAWKGYPGQPLGPEGRGWWMDDEKVGYPALELSRRLKIRTICAHKGLPAPGFSAEHCHPKDIMKAAVDFPDLNFLVYHAGFRGVDQALAEAARAEFATSADVPWVSELCGWKRRNPSVKNVYLELGSTFGMTVITFPILCAHLLGMMIGAFGDDHILWGTDAIWWGSPQWQIEAFKRFEMPESLMKRFGYKPLTTEVKGRILGLNAARVYGVNPEARLRPVPDDYIDRLQKRYKDSGLASRSDLRYGWIAS